ncbi:Uncharacterized protein CK203_053509 [Vitis vinifera]|uniref:Alpha 1,4-glycosyltransferase domain-containing protein n=1 Tax=Vitis vinifera TaxID=29760 RepID=A0A438FZ42_VITVI|nr:Uncharacterized protein CK203_035749 [Vitis vinifera]RVX07149.1 Uncharacterized protein CK203_053509 [Vitis vinifera]
MHWVVSGPRFCKLFTMESWKFSLHICLVGFHCSHILPPFFLTLQIVNRYFTTPATETEKAEQDILFSKILNESFTFHFWNSLTSSLIPEPESLVARLIDHSCIRCSDVL